MDNYASKKERREQRKQEKEIKTVSDRKTKKIKKYSFWTIILVIVIGILFFVVKSTLNRKNLPPMISQGHIEESPSSHILDEPMPEKIQRHMFEHADGSGSPGIIIQYNCSKFECADDLVERLIKIVNEYPENVYLAPGPDYDGKIILTKEGNIEILEEFDADKIRNFIEK